MQYRFPVFAKSANGPVELPGDVDAMTEPGSIFDIEYKEIDPDDLIWKVWRLHNPDGVEIHPAALTGMVNAAYTICESFDLVAPWTLDRLPRAPGCNDAEMAMRVFQNDNVEPYQMQGALPPVYMQRIEGEHWPARKAFRATRSWVPSHGDFGRPYDRAVDVAKEIAKYVKSVQRQVVFLFREFPICGVTLAAVHICNGLNKLGWNATIACTALDPVQAKLFPFEFGPMVFKGRDEMVNVVGKRMQKDSVVIAPVHAMVDDAVECSEASGARMIYYVQDDEGRFKHVSGEPYLKKGEVEKGWDKAAEHGGVVANSRWVANAVYVETGKDLDFVPIGVDTKMFEPGDRSAEPFRIMAHCRPSTPRRGWAFVCAVLNQLAVRGLRFEAVTYDEEPEGLQVNMHRHLGKISPQQVAEAMSGAHIFVEGSDVQGFGMQALEAMSSGCALVCTDNKGIHTFGADRINCRIVGHNVGRAVDAVVDLAMNAQKRMALGRAARVQSLGFDWRVVSEAWNRVLLKGDAGNEKDTEPVPGQCTKRVSS